jgi:hypothetical protein
MKKCHQMIYTFIGTLLFSCLLLFATNALAVKVNGNSYSITIQGVPSGIISIKVAGPDGVIYTANGLTVYSEDGFVDGDYQYELIGYLSDSKAHRKQKSKADQGVSNANGRASDVAPYVPEGVVKTGDFRIVNGQVVDTRHIVEKDTGKGER